MSSEKELVNRLNLLLEINASINSTRNLGELLSKITNITSVVMQAEASSIALMDDETNELVFQFVHGEVSDKIRTFRVPVGSGISGWVAKYGVPLIVPDAQKDPRFNRKADEESSFVTKSVICVPLKREDKVTGILQTLNKRDGGVFSNEDLTIFESLASIAAIAIENAQLYDLLNTKLVQLEDAKKRTEYILDQLKRSEEETEKLKSVVNTRGAFSGKIEVFRVENLVQMLSNDYKTGRLDLSSSEGSASIYFQNGKLKHANINDRPLEGINAFYETICWQDGDFSFEDGVNQEKHTIDKMSMSIIIEGLRRLDESKALREKYPDSLVFQIDKAEEIAQHSENPERKVILEAIDGIKSIGEIIKNAPLDRYSTLDTVKALDDEKLISAKSD